MKNKKNMIALLSVAIVCIVGLTIAYFTNTTSIVNEFNTNPYGTTVIEEFVSPDNWLPGTTTMKTLTVTNSGEVDEAVRIKYQESWISKNGDELPLSQGDNTAAIINFTNVNDWTESTENGKNYYYYNYKLAPNEVTSTLLESVTFNDAITNDSDCQTTDSDGTKTITCNSTGDGYDGATYTLTFTIETVQYDKYKTAWGTNINILEEKPQVETFAQHIMNNANALSITNYTDGVTTEAYTFSHEATEQTPALTDYRYIGASPNNYVEFNCDDNGENCEVWRAIGVFKVDDGEDNWEWRVKLVRGNSIKNDYWNTERNSNNGTNDWTADNATLKLFLNGVYYDNTESEIKNDYDLKALARNMIGDAVYYLGATYPFDEEHSAEKLYSNERGNTLCGSCGSELSKLTWTGKVGLMYPSDMYMTYKGINEDCYNTPANSCNDTNAANGWVYNSNKLSTETNPNHTWFLSSDSLDADYALFACGGFLDYDPYTGNLSKGVRPTLYLSSSVKTTSGDGSVDSPYKLSL